MIRIEHLHKIYQLKDRKIAALTDINLSINKGEIFGMIGRSGAGKSSLIRTFNLLERPSQGRVLINNEDITTLNRAQLYRLRQSIGMIFQHFNLMNAKTVAQNIAWPLKLTGQYTAAQCTARVNELLELVGLLAHRTQYPAQLSGGQKQRVGIARALANHPQLLLCDEATSALDPETTQSILHLLLDINRQLGVTIVLITHEMQVIRSICDRVAVIDKGHIVEMGAVADVFLHPQHEVTQALVAQSHRFDAIEANLLPADANRTLVRLTFRGDITYQPILNHIVMQTTAQISILQGTIDRIKDIPYGQLLIALEGQSVDIAQVFSLLVQQGIHYQVVQA